MAKLLGSFIFAAGFISWLFVQPDVSDSSAVSAMLGKSEDESASSIFDERIMPIFRSPDPSSCVECHLSSVDLKDYILPSHEKTFLSLRDQGLVDLENPSESKILKLIEMGERAENEGAQLINAKLRKAELEAFSSWIEACASDERLRNLPKLDKSELARPANPDGVIRHARKSRVVDSFVRNIWSQRMRCFPCHTPNEIGPNQKPAIKKFEKWNDEFGERMLIFKETPEATIDYLMEKSKEVKPGEFPLINLNEPSKSLLILKPTSKIPPLVDGERTPSSTTPVFHLGGLKMHKNDHSFKSFNAWIADYAKVVNGKYSSVDDLPVDNWLATQRVLRMKEVPEAWNVGTTVQLFVFEQTSDGNIGREPVGFTQGTITPRWIVNGPLFLFGPSDPDKFKEWEARESKLAPGNYLVKVYVDGDSKLETDPTTMLSEDDYQGQIKLENAKWAVNFKNAEWISASQLAK